MVKINLENNIYLMQDKPNKWKVAEKRVYNVIDKEGNQKIRTTHHKPKYFSSPDKALEYYFLEMRLENYEITTLEKLIEILDESRKLIKERLGVIND
jgi:hypothetical protein